MMTMNTKTVYESGKELEGWLVVTDGPVKGKDFPLLTGKTVVGTSPSADICIYGSNLDPFHFSIRCENGEIRLTDLDSETGTLLNGDKIRHALVPDETRFKASQSEFLIKKLNRIN